MIMFGESGSFELLGDVCCALFHREHHVHHHVSGVGERLDIICI